MSEYWLNPEIKLIECASNEDIEGMRKAVKLGATDFNWASKWAASEGKIEAMRELKKMGATDFKGALKWAACEGQIEAYELLLKWMKERKEDE